MNIDKILAYQKKDGEILKLQTALDKNVNKKTYQDAAAVAKKAQVRCEELEREAGALINEFNILKKTYEDNSKSANVLTGKLTDEKIDNLNRDELEGVEDLASDISSNLSILEKKILIQAERVNAILSEFEQAKKKYNVARDKYKTNKATYQAELDKINPEIERLKKELKELEPQINEFTKQYKKDHPELDIDFLKLYNQKRQDAKFPYFVAINNKNCGCGTELSVMSLNNLKTKGFTICESCRRVIYDK